MSAIMQLMQVVSMAEMAREQVDATRAILFELAKAKAMGPLVSKELDTGEPKPWASMVTI